ncbi:hypothetical protein BDF22DRAFT_666998 [Syncephalis plumigaleata]|nr:hypothetical protein BDF22DRAFT_666998 [Syncephalis plumigaleata]
MADTSSTSWADEVLELPTRQRGDDQFSSSNRGGYNDRYANRGERSERYTRERRPPAALPDEPPFTAYIGNLPYDLRDEDVEEFFGNTQINNVRIIRDFNDRPKGFGYVEFADRDALAAAVERDGQSINGRNIRVNVAEPPKEKSGYGEDKTNVESWRRAGAVESPRRSTFGERSGSPRRHPAEGGKYGARRNDDDARRSAEPSVSDTASTWRRQEPIERSAPLSPGPSSGGERRRGWGFNRQGGDHANDEHRSYSNNRFRGGEERDGGRSPFSHSRRTSIESRGSAYGGDSSSVISPRPAERKKLELKPRTVPVSADPVSPAPPSARSARSNPFGDAKPRDENEMLRRVEERHQQRKAGSEHSEDKETSSENKNHVDNKSEANNDE